MGKNLQNNIKLGAFVLIGLFLLVLLLYLLGKNQNLFGRTFPIKTRFNNAQGLVAGNNVRYAGIQVGTVKSIKIINDKEIEVTMMVDDKMQAILQSNATASIGTDGLMGNKLVNLTPATELGTSIQSNQILSSKESIDTDEMLRVLNKTNADVADIARSLKITVSQINESKGLWSLLNDPKIPENVRDAAIRINRSTRNVEGLSADILELVSLVKNGQGILGQLIHDTGVVTNIQAALLSFLRVGDHADSLLTTMQAMVAGFDYELRNGKGAVNTLLMDSVMVLKLNNSLNNIEKGTAGFNENMEALKASFLLRGYFRRLQKQKERERESDIGVKTPGGRS